MKNERMKKDFRSTNNRARGNSVRRGKEQTEAPKAEKPVKPVVRTIPTFDDIKKQLEAWAETNRIPGKIQAWYTDETLPEHSDWRIIKTYRG